MCVSVGLMFLKGLKYPSDKPMQYIASGASGVVIKAIDLNTPHQEVAIKITHFKGYSDNDIGDEERILSIIHGIDGYNSGPQ